MDHRGFPKTLAQGLVIRLKSPGQAILEMHQSSRCYSQAEKVAQHLGGRPRAQTSPDQEFRGDGLGPGS